MLVEVSGLSELFRALSDETRTKILYLLSEQELCVCDLAHLLETSLPAVSHHLRLLKIMRLVKSRKEGKQVF
ncbi:MAG: metalloregulator ArsR/SmtB family transcription factor, partial [Spirochaetia bacterium]